MICESKKTIKILKASIFKCKKISFLIVKFPREILLKVCLAPHLKILKFLVYQLKKIPISQMFGAPICLEYA